MQEKRKHTDKDLRYGLKSGDKHCFNQLFRKYYSQVYPEKMETKKLKS